MDFHFGAVLARLLTAVALGALVGFEREVRQKPAGLRTHMMVALGSAAFTVATLGIDTGTDPSRIVQGIATGIGFLGAGSIMQRNGNIEGLTTAAGIWVVGAVGVSCGIGEYATGIVTAVVSALTLSLVGKMEPKITGKE